MYAGRYIKGVYEGEKGSNERGESRQRDCMKEDTSTKREWENRVKMSGLLELIGPLFSP